MVSSASNLRNLSVQKVRWPLYPFELMAMQKKVMLTVPKEYTEVSFKNRGGFEAGYFVRLVVCSKLVNYLIK